VGLRSWILGPYIRDLERLSQETKELKAEVRELKGKLEDLAKFHQDTLKELIEVRKALEAKADKKEMERELESLSKLVMAVYDKLKELETYSEFSPGESLDPESEEVLVLDLIRQGYTSPSELVSRLKMGNKKLYAILKRLEAKGKLRKLRKKRRVHYILVEE
jgi:chromosome segregation ATPase